MKLTVLQNPYFMAKIRRTTK